MKRASTCVRRRANAPRAAIYRALLDEKAVAKWKVPTIGEVLALFDKR